MTESIKSIPLDKLHPFPDHPFGVLVPAIARPCEEGDDFA